VILRFLHEQELIVCSHVEELDSLKHVAMRLRSWKLPAMNGYGQNAFCSDSKLRMQPEEDLAVVTAERKKVPVCHLC